MKQYRVTYYKQYGNLKYAYFDKLAKARKFEISANAKGYLDSYIEKNSGKRNIDGTGDWINVGR